MKILVVGSNGQLGRELQKQLHDNHELFSFDLPELDIANYEQVRKIIHEIAPAVVINAAAYTNVEKAEDNEELAFLINGTGAHYLALVSKEINAKFIHISTDYVFDGKSKQPYEEMDVPSPLSVYGKSKLLGEKLVQEVGGNYFILRTSWLYGDGHNFIRTMLQLAKQGKEIRVVDDQYGTPTYTKDLCWVIEQLIQTDCYGIYHVSNEGACSWYELARKIFELARIRVNLHPVSTAEYITKAKRPQYGVLENKRLKLQGIPTMRSWERALGDYIDNLSTEAVNGSLQNVL